MDSRNMQDPAVQEKIRRGSHEYVLGDGRHGSYREKSYQHSEYPKMMDRTPAPVRKDFKTDAEFVLAYDEWKDQTQRSIVNTKAEETAWTKKNAKAN